MPVQERPAPERNSTPRPFGAAHRYATAAYIIYALVFLGLGVFAAGKTGKSGWLLSSAFQVPAFYSLLILFLAFSRSLRGLIAILAGIHLAGGLCGVVTILCASNPVDRGGSMEWVWTILAVDISVLLPLAVVIAALVERIDQERQLRNGWAWNEWRRRRQKERPPQERVSLKMKAQPPERAASDRNPAHSL